MSVVPIPSTVQPLVSPIVPADNSSKKTNHAKTDNRRAVEDSTKARGARGYDFDSDKHSDDPADGYSADGHIDVIA